MVLKRALTKQIVKVQIAPEYEWSVTNKSIFSMKTLSERLQIQNVEVEEVSVEAIKAGRSVANDISKSEDTLDGGTLDEVVVTPDRTRGHGLM